MIIRSPNPIVIMLAILIAGCNQATNVRVDTKVPLVIVEMLPVTIGVYYDPALRNHRYTEDTSERPNWVIDSGHSQVALFDSVLTATFSQVISVEELPTSQAPTGLDLIVAPTISEMQFATPNETFFDFYEAWIRYDIELLRADGRSIDNWEITAYGRSPKRRFASRVDGLHRAIDRALRDIGAKLSTGLAHHPAIEQLLEKQR